MIRETKGNLLEAEVEALVNTVNTVGVMGKGIALQFCQAMPAEYFKQYQKACQDNSLQIGTVQLFHLSSIEFPHYVVNFPTKRHWKGKSRLEDIAVGLPVLVEKIKEYGIKYLKRKNRWKICLEKQQKGKETDT